MTKSDIPKQTTALVIGGGPAGSYAASALRREGIEVTLLEAANFPRYHIGESLLASVNTFLRFIDARDKVAAHGFQHKPGAAVKLQQHKREGYTDFVALDPKNGAWNVVRSEFDEILLRHAESLGVKVFEGTRVTDIVFEHTQRRPVSVKYVRSTPATSGEISFDYLVDCSGRAGLMSTKYNQDRKMNASLKNAAAWSYWRNCGVYGENTNRHNAPYFEALLDESGWVWFIPLHDGTVSVGVVMNEEKFRAGKAQAGSLEAHYMKQLDLVPGLRKLIGNGTIDRKKTKPVIQQASDYSYQADSYAGPGYRIAGDAGAFIDPFFSSGVHLAFAGGLSAAASISSVLRGDTTEEVACNFHTKKVGSAYTRFMLVVMGVYQQITKQKHDVMSDVDEDNFDRAFDLIRPVIQGATETGVAKKVSEAELYSTMDFVKNLFAIDHEMQAEVEAKYASTDLFKSGAPVLTPQQIRALTQDELEQDVLLEVNARKVVHRMYDPEKDFDNEVIDGVKVNMQVGHLTIVPPTN